MVLLGTGRSPRRRPGTALRRAVPVLGAAGAQFSQAAGSFVVSVLSLRQTDVHVFATLSLALGALVVVTSISTGLIGDPLTVLDRHDPATRTALRRLLLVVLVAVSVLGAVAPVAGGLLGVGEGLMFGLLVAVWVLEDVLRRLLIAGLHFWRVVAVDLTHLVVVVGILEVAATLSARPPGVTRFFLALIVGQLAALALAVGILPGPERYLGPAVAGRVGAVLRYGASRAVQGLLRPGVLLLLRVVVLAVCGTRALAVLEVGRIVTAPALLLVAGGGSYLLSRHAARARTGGTEGRRDADRAALLLAVAAFAVMSVVSVAVLAVPRILGGTPVGRTGSETLVPLLAAWGGYVLSVAVAMPYTSLGAVLVPQARLLRARVADAAAQVAGGLVLLAVAPTSWLLLPLLLGAVSLTMTWTVLRSLLGSPGPGPGPGSGAGSATERGTSGKEARGEPGVGLP
ncbi:MAG: hypothetical protein P8Z68_00390 [Kineosporiaceae bacterium]